MFPAEYTGDVFAAEHGSWNHAKGAGHEVIRIPIEKGKASGVYEDFLTGFNTDANLWGRPAGIATATDGSLLVTGDGVKFSSGVSLTPASNFGLRMNRIPANVVCDPRL